ncbi:MULTISPECIES: alpha/beta fold hydrolase [unclassified Massilia]|uniref:alpha/beta fold hydrolase n=1 Tax=unclassified Massilia TaxID=2609279 RepID=UPI00178723A4|nr:MULTISPECIES: alpha/beta hydrolase [unclassified Massilia]MBD8529395.1 alpha/beta hydrolase [Massilia sp. CFBP 13647]MBD8672788.1 alpha/beta hydrolase [Massilia sp. CFBP 13721]
MILNIADNAAYCYSGGKPFDAALPMIVFIHGAQNDHSVWGLQSRWFAHHGYGVLAVDLPGHGRSAGSALTSVEAMADWLLALLDAAGVAQAILVGHSMGSLVALEASKHAPERVRALAMLGTTYPMKVSDALLATSRDDEGSAIDMVNIWSHSSIAHKPSSPGPGFSVLGGARRLMQRMSAINPDGLFHNDFAACNAYADGEAAAQAVRCPTLFIFGSKDMMTPARSTKTLTGAIAHGKVVQVDAGHSLMSEQPDGVLDALAAFAAGLKQQEAA